MFFERQVLLQCDSHLSVAAPLKRNPFGRQPIKDWALLSAELLCYNSRDLITEYAKQSEVFYYRSLPLGIVTLYFSNTSFISVVCWYASSAFRQYVSTRRPSRAMKQNDRRHLIWLSLSFLMLYLLFGLLVLTHVLALPLQAITAATVVLMCGLLAVLVTPWVKVSERTHRERLGLGLSIVVLIVMLLLLLR
ncbi:hypothetical protein SE17_08540 [Kouleothrix aurantiaca]|uniref:Uncharacterized protein n=1 Tax=Kouleothrix aurantiaca TaxID=186479 RepID=A0A0P9DJI8_9CHLR|nr:hypothetical protein SE17_08540 [Kouleothrix aurantiaca]